MKAPCTVPCCVCGEPIRKNATARIRTGSSSVYERLMHPRCVPVGGRSVNPQVGVHRPFPRKGRAA